MADDIQRLLRTTSGRQARAELRELRFLVDGGLLEEVKERLAADRVTMKVLVEAVLRGYVRRHPAVAAMVDDWVREEKSTREVVPRTGGVFRKAELDSIYDELEGPDGVEE